MGQSAEARRRGAQRPRAGAESGDSEGAESSEARRYCSGEQHLHSPISASAVRALPLIAYAWHVALCEKALYEMREFTFNDDTRSSK